MSQKSIPTFYDSELFEIFGHLVGLFGVVLILAGPCQFGWELFQWLKTGVWPDMTVAEGFEWMGWAMPAFDWVGVQQVSNWIMMSDLSGALTIGGWLAFVLLAVTSIFVQS